MAEYPLQEFTADETARLQAFEDAPFAPEARYRDENKLVPTGLIQPAHVVVPEPPLSNGTADDWARHYLAKAHARRKLSYQLMPRVEFTPDTLGPYVEALSSSIEAFTLGYAFRQLTDDQARELGTILDLGDHDELTWDWLVELGVDPDHIASAEVPGG